MWRRRPSCPPVRASRIFGADANDRAGQSVSSAGDINGDGFDDLIVGAGRSSGSANGKSFAGEAIVVFGKAGGFGNIDVAAADFVSSGTGFRIFGADANDRAGQSVSSAGDINGDGFDDLIVGASSGYGSGNSTFIAGEAIVVFGKAGGFGDIDVAAADFVSSGKGFRIFGADVRDQAGNSVSSAGDINGDGFDDLIVGAYRSSGSGNFKTYAARRSWCSARRRLRKHRSGGGGLRVVRQGLPHLRLGLVRSGGRLRLLGGRHQWRRLRRSDRGAHYGDGSANGKSNAGEAIVVFGKAGGFGDIDVAAADFVSSGKGFRIFGADADDRAGISVSSAGDVNGDGFDDLIVGVHFGDGSTNGKLNAGEAIVCVRQGRRLRKHRCGGGGFRVLRQGLPHLWCGSRRLGRLLRLFRRRHQRRRLRRRLIVGAVTGDGSANDKSVAGEAIVIFGGDFLSGVVFAGTNADNTLTGTSANETFVGGQGNDTLVGGGGSDAFQGGEGDDIVELGSTLARRADGGTGIDTVRLDAVNGGGTLDLTGLDAKRFQNIEKIDLSGTNANTLLLSKLAVLGMAGSNGNAFDDNTLLIKGDAGDRLQILDGWTKGAAVSNPSARRAATSPTPTARPGFSSRAMLRSTPVTSMRPP